MGGHEVVKVTYKGKELSADDLDTYAEQASCNKIKEASNYKLASKDVQYKLRHSLYRFLPLSLSQRTHINSAISKNEDGSVFLSPQQLEWFRSVKNTKEGRVLYDLDLIESWNLILASKG